MTMRRIAVSVLLAAVVLVARPSAAVEPATGATAASEAACIDALYQLEVLRLGTRVFKPGPGDERTYLHDRDRPAEIERSERVARQNCSTDPAQRQAQAARASELVIALGPDCAAARERLATLERPDSRSSPATVDRQREYVAANCPDLSRDDVWLADRVIVRNRP
jgi:hypothetical protein